MNINYEGKEYKFDLEEIDLAQASIIFDKYGLTLMTLEAGLGDGNPAALRAIYWLMLCQNGESTDIERVNCKIVKFARAVDEAGRAELGISDGEEVAPVPKESPA